MIDTVIVGGGIAGLTMAKYFLDRKEPITLLEWYPKVGGRIATYRNGDIEYESGAKRIHRSHNRVLALLKQFHLRTRPMSNTTYFHNDPNIFSDVFPPLMRVLQTLDSSILQSNTIEQLLPVEFHSLFKQFPYYAEIHTLRADIAIPLFLTKGVLGSAQDYITIDGGVDQLITNLEAQLQGVDLRVRYRVEDIQKVDDGFELTGKYGKRKTEQPFRIVCRRLVIATEYRSFQRFSILDPFEFMKYITDSPLTRIYAIYPTVKGKAWFHDIPTTVVDSPLRFLSPIDLGLGLILISYTDGSDTAFWKNLEGDELQNMIQKELRAVFPTKHIPEPTYLNKHEWIQGCTYWKPGSYSLDDMVKQAHHPMKNLYICGESVNPHQSWMESALESAERVQSLL